MVTGAQAKKKKTDFETRLNEKVMQLADRLETIEKGRYQDFANYLRNIVGEDREDWRHNPEMTFEVYFPRSMRSEFDDLAKLLNDNGVGAKIRVDSEDAPYIQLGAGAKQREQPPEAQAVIDRIEETPGTKDEQELARKVAEAARVAIERATQGGSLKATVEGIRSAGPSGRLSEGAMGWIEAQFKVDTGTEYGQNKADYTSLQNEHRSSTNVIEQLRILEQLESMMAASKEAFGKMAKSFKQNYPNEAEAFDAFFSKVSNAHTTVAGSVETARKQIKEGKLQELKEQLDTQLTALRRIAHAKPDDDAIRMPRVAHAHDVLTQIRESLEREGTYLDQNERRVGLDRLLVGLRGKEGGVVAIENAIKEAQDAQRAAQESIKNLELLGENADVQRKTLETLQKRIGEDVLSYQPAPLRVKNEEGGYDIYTTKVENGKTIYAISNIEETEQLARGPALGDKDVYVSRLYALGLTENVTAYDRARKALIENLSAAQLDEVIEYAAGRKDSLSLDVPAAKQKDVYRAMQVLCNINGFRFPEADIFAEGTGKINLGKPQPFVASAESVKLLREWAGNYLTTEERNLLASRFSYQDIQKMVNFMDQARLAFSQGREFPDGLSIDHAIRLPGEVLDLQTERALNSLFLYAGGISIAFRENAGYLYTTEPTMYSEPEVIQFEFPKKISHAGPNGRMRWLNTERVSGRASEIEEAVNGREGGEINMGRPLRDTKVNRSLLDAHIRNAEIIVGYLNQQGIRARVGEYNEPGRRPGTELTGIRVIIPSDAMKIGETQRNPRKVEMAEAPLLGEGPVRENPLEAVSLLPMDIASRAMRDQLLSLMREKKEGMIECRSLEQATRMRNWLVTRGGIPGENITISSEQIEKEITEGGVGIERMVATETLWRLAYIPGQFNTYSFNAPKVRAEGERVHPTAAEEARRNTALGKELRGSLDGAIEGYESRNPQMEVEVVEFSQPGGSRKKDHTPTASQSFHNESSFGDAFIGLAYELNRRTEAGNQKAPAVGGFRRLRHALETNLNAATLDGEFKNGGQVAMMMLREWRHPGRDLALDQKKGVSNAYLALEEKYGTLENLMASFSEENAIKFEAATGWLAQRWMQHYTIEGMSPEQVESLRNSLAKVAGFSMMVLIMMEAGPAHFGVGPGEERPQTPQAHLAGASLYMGNTEFTVVKAEGKAKGAPEVRKTYFEHEGVQYNILSRLVLSAGPNPGRFVTIPTNDPNKVILYGRVTRENVQLEDGTWVPAFNVRVLPPEERKVMDRDSLGEAAFTPLFTGPLPYAKLRLKAKPPEETERTINVATRVPVGARVEGDQVMFAAGMEIRWNNLYLRFLSPKEKIFASMKGNPVMLDEIVVTSETPNGERFLLPPRQRQNSKGVEIDGDRRYPRVPGGTVYSSAYVEPNGNVVVFQKKGKSSPENARDYYKSAPDELASKGIERIVIGSRDPQSGRVALKEHLAGEYSKHIFGSRLVRSNELVEEGSVQNEKGETVDYRYRLENANIGAHRKVVAAGTDQNTADVRTNLPLEFTETTTVTLRVKTE